MHSSEAGHMMEFVSWLRARGVELAERSWGEHRPLEVAKIEQLADEFARERAARSGASERCTCPSNFEISPRCPRHGMTPGDRP